MQAPRNDLDFLQTFQAYLDKEIANAAAITFALHPWYLAEHLVGFALFDEKVNITTKRKMVNNFERQKKPGCPRRLQGVPEIGVGLEEFVTKRTLKMFSLIAEQRKGADKSSFLNENPKTWETSTMCSWK